MDTLEAANAIRQHVDFDHEQKISVDDRHQINFVTEVCRHLGLEPNVVWFNHVQDVLAQQNIIHSPDEYPKMLTNDEGQPILDPETKQPIIYHAENDEVAAAAAKRAKQHEAENAVAEQRAKEAAAVAAAQMVAQEDVQHAAAKRGAADRAAAEQAAAAEREAADRAAAEHADENTGRHPRKKG
jgi:hypothetical protein